MPNPIQLPPYGLRRYNDKGSVLIVEPTVYMHNDFVSEKPPRRVGDVANILLGTQHVILSRREDYEVEDTAPATVVSVEVKRVRDLTLDEWKASGMESFVPCQHDDLLWPGQQWAAKHPAYPFDTAWAWLIELRKEKRDGE